jgi:hypothetical protein
MEATKVFIGRVYKLISSETPHVYVGSTRKSLVRRLRGHKNDYTCYVRRVYPYVSSYEVVKHADVKIELLFEGEFTSLKDLGRLEGEYIQATENCINKCIAGRTKKEWEQAKKEHRKEVAKRYYEANKEKILQQHKERFERDKEAINAAQRRSNVKYYQKNKDKFLEKVTCETCSGVYVKKTRVRHERSQRHQKAVNKEPEAEDELKSFN